MKKRNLIFGIMLFGAMISSHNPIYSQQPATQETSKPVELPNFIIEGVEQLNVRSGVKQMPSRVAPLNSKELDSLNSLEKHTSILIAPDQLPSRSISRVFPKGFAKGSLGLYTTPQLDFGIGQKIEGYELYANGGLELSSGDVKRSDFFKFNLKGYSDYIAPDKFWIFGGSRTRTSVFFKTQSYNLYAEPLSMVESSYYDRNALNFGVKLETEGSYDNVVFNTGFKVASMQLSADKNAAAYHPSKKAFDNEYQGFLKVKSLWNNYLVSGDVLLDFHSLRTNPTNFLQVSGSASYFTKDFTVSGALGFQSAVNSAGNNRGGLLLQADLEYRYNRMLTIKGSFTSGLENNSYSELYEINPYLNFSNPIDFLYNIALIQGSIVYHPVEKFTFAGAVRWRVADRLHFFDDSDNSTFSVRYDQGTILELTPEVIWDITNSDQLSADMTYSVGALNNYSGNIPYYPLMKTSFSYRKTLFEKLGLALSFAYIGKRDVSVDDNKKIDGYSDLAFAADYRFNSSFVLFANFNNLTSSNVYVWNNYKERGLFAKIGVLWQF